MVAPLIIARRFRGPRTSANGGYASGLLAQAMPELGLDEPETEGRGDRRGRQLARRHRLHELEPGALGERVAQREGILPRIRPRPHRPTA